MATEPPASVEVSGVVRDSEGNALPYVTIFVEGTSCGTTTDADGRYKLIVSEGDALTAQMMGYETMTRDIDMRGSMNIDFQMAESAMAIDAVVVSASGVGNIKRSAFNAVAVDMQPLKNRQTPVRQRKQTRFCHPPSNDSHRTYLCRLSSQGS